MTIQSDPVVLAQRFLFALARLAAKRRGVTFGTPVIDPAGVVLYVPCSDGIVALRVRGASFSPPWHSTGFTPGPPIVAAGLVWDASRGGSLRALDLSSGQVRYQAGQGYWGYLSGLTAMRWTGQ